jgi:hypothetical protein
VNWSDHINFYQINISIPDPFANAFFAYAGRIYWLAVHIVTDVPDTIGWKTSREHWEDAAVFSGVPGGQWMELRDPEMQTPLDMAFVIGYDPSLPVTLSTFTAATSGDNVILKWRTETEVNNLGFAIYRSETKDGNYTKIAFVKGAGSTAMPTDYQFVDKKAEADKTYFYYLEDIDIAGTKNRNDIIKVVVPAKLAQTIPKKFRLLQNFPNPFNPETWIPYDLASDATVSIYIYNVQGRLVRHLNMGKQEAGRYLTKDRSAYWDGKDESGERVASGVYWYTLRAGEFDATRRMVILK